ncbi:hypothetical protein [Fischerella sp. JS2]|uniref:hypothetical protein n=1 Tax=Fischerella sp. JS2 TaxID=2597771 RepID=UPI0028E4B7B1|nr:hypothetical protein [Fischerella sp. JS2]
MKYYHALPPVLIGVSMVLVQSQVAVAISPQEVEKIGREITVRIVDSQNPTIAGSRIIVKRSGNTYTVLTAYHVVKDNNNKKYQIFTPDVVAAAPKADDFYIRGYNKIGKKDYKGAIADYTEAIRLNPNYAQAY